jgi:hypothetical protein
VGKLGVCWRAAHPRVNVDEILDEDFPANGLGFCGLVAWMTTIGV